MVKAAWYSGGAGCDRRLEQGFEPDFATVIAGFEQWIWTAVQGYEQDGRGASLQRQGKFEDAMLYYSRVLAISKLEGEDSATTEAYGAIADCFTELGDLERAANYYDKYIERLCLEFFNFKFSLFCSIIEFEAAVGLELNAYNYANTTY
ncbi:hypothetical protein IEQ34_011583 [Dendrobium chrysotoxum]|uniref:Uncharacterized protein n=1 Tax=Dendrobium chrysotoxum TaxID=161865 RepID=A0AAV7GSP4_DENCH|nr:hypothetical protein IEQ34_011583 [Dendrobium chrysotoxum]